MWPGETWNPSRDATAIDFVPVTESSTQTGLFRQNDEGMNQKECKQRKQDH
jgi:hypothetical protein